MPAILQFIQNGHIERAGNRGSAQLEVRISDGGRTAAPPLSESDGN
jgi:hypothetical protein